MALLYVVAMNIGFLTTLLAWVIGGGPGLVALGKGWITIFGIQVG